MADWLDIQRDTLLVQGMAAAETDSLALFVQRLLARNGQSGARIALADRMPPATEISRAAAPIDPEARLVALDMPSLLHLRDCRKIALLAPARLRQDLAALAREGAERLAIMAEWQDALRQCDATLVFDPAHAPPLLALGAPRVDTAPLPAMPPLRDAAATTDLLLIDHEGGALADELAASIRAALPALGIAQAGAGAQSARIHIHLGARAAAGPRVIDSHAMNRPVIQMAGPDARIDPAMWVEPMRTGLRAESIDTTIAALIWLDAHPVFIDIFRPHAERAMEEFNRAAEAGLRAILVSS